MILQAYGMTDTPEEEIQDLGKDGVTSVSDLTNLLQQSQCVVSAVSKSTVPSLLNTGYALFLIRDDGNAAPYPTGPNFSYHWIVGYRNNGATCQCANPWGGLDIAYDWATLLAATQWVGIVTYNGPQPGDSPLWMNRNVKLLPGTTDGYQLDGWGGLHPLGNMPQPRATGYWPNWNIARYFDLAPDGSVGVVVDGFGGLHPFAARSAEIPPYPVGYSYWKGWDIVGEVIVTDWPTLSGYTIDDFGGAHPFGTNPPPTLVGMRYFPNNQV